VTKTFLRREASDAGTGSLQLPSINATMCMVTRRTTGNAMKAVAAATGQAMMNAESQRWRESARAPVF
jgi:hypothetical protein